MIEVGSRTEDGAVTVTVADNGRGIEKDDLTRIFDPEVRGSNVTDEPGSGLGLALCRRVMERHGGTVLARSREGGGTIFELRYPQGGEQEADGLIGSEAGAPEHA